MADFVNQLSSVMEDKKENLPLLIASSIAVLVLSSQIKNIYQLVVVGSCRWYLNLFILSKKTPVATTTVTQLFVYPVKSLRALNVEVAVIDKKGFLGDRRLMLVTPAPTPLWGSFGPDDATHRFLTQRQCPSLATVLVKQEPKRTLTFSSHMVPNRKISVLSVPTKESPIYKASLWGDTVSVQDMGDEAAAFFNEIIERDEEIPDEYKGGKVRLVIQRPDDERLANKKYVPAALQSWKGATPPVALSDGFPFLIANEASLKELNKRLKNKGKDPIKMSNFRPNIVVKGVEPFEEDRWKVIRIGEAIFHIVKGCPRCKQSCTDQITGTVREEPLETLAEFRAMTSNLEHLYFAQNAIVNDRSIGSTIRKGDKVEILQVGQPVWED